MTNPSSNHNQSVNQPQRSHSGMGQENLPANHSHNQSSMSAQAQNTHRNENLLCAVLALIKELNESELELIKRDIEKKLQQKQSQK